MSPQRMINVSCNMIICLDWKKDLNHWISNDEDEELEEDEHPYCAKLRLLKEEKGRFGSCGDKR